MINIETAISEMKKYVAKDERVSHVAKTKDSYIFCVDTDDKRYGQFSSKIYAFVMDGISGKPKGIGFEEYCQLVDQNNKNINWMEVESLK